MPFFGRKKSDKSNKETRPKSQFFDQSAQSVDTLHSSDKKLKRTSRSTFYEELPANKEPSQTDHTLSKPTTSPAISLPNERISVEPQGDLGRPQVNDRWSKRTSVLSRSFADCLFDKDLIGYFMQFLASKDSGHLLKFWMAAQNFHDASIVRIRGQSNYLNPNERDRHIATSHDQSQEQLAISHNTSHSGLPRHKENGDDLHERIKADAVNIYSRYISLDCPTDIGITEELRNSTISKICSEGGTVEPLCFKDCQVFIEGVLKEGYYKAFLESSYYRKYQIDCLTSGNLQLTDLLYNDNIMFYFMEFVEQENASSLLQFWMAVDNFQSQLEDKASNYTGRDAQSDAMVLYDKYFSLQASEPLGFSDKVRRHVELNICRESGPLPDCFLIPKIIILETMEKTLFQQFLHSQIYYRFLSELISSAQPTNHLGTPKIISKSLHRTGSASSYDTHSLGGHSIVSNTDGKVSASSSTSDVRSAKSGAELDDLPLWKRAGHRKNMSLGHFDEFGQYVSELDLESMPDLDKKKGSRFSRKKREKEKAQEEMAWQIAKMIINDINKEVSSSQDRNTNTDEHSTQPQSTKL